MPISIIILTYNSSSHIKSLLKSVFEILDSGIKKGEVEIIFFDNASKDDTLKRVGGFGNIEIIKSSDNLGYAKGINEAVKKAKGEIVVVINPDAKLIKFDENAIEKSFADEKLGVLGFNIKNSNGERENNAGKFFNPLTFLFYSLGLEDMLGLRFSPDKNVKVDYVSGGFVAFRKSFFEKVKGYDESYFMYVEDMDICYRAKKIGFKVMFSNDASIMHIGQGSSNREFAIVNIYKGLVTFYRKNSSYIMQLYVNSLLLVKAALIIFLASVFGKSHLRRIYTAALRQII